MVCGKLSKRLSGYRCCELPMLQLIFLPLIQLCSFGNVYKKFKVFTIDVISIDDPPIKQY